MAHYYQWNGIVVENSEGKKVCVVLSEIIDPKGSRTDPENRLRTCVSVRFRSRNLYRKYNAWGFDDDVIKRLEELNVKIIFIVEKEFKTVYAISMKGAKVYGIKIPGQLLIPLSAFKFDDSQPMKVGVHNQIYPGGTL